MKKIHILTCVNKGGDVVAVTGYKSHDEAHSDMEASVKGEIESAEAGGYSFDDGDGEYEIRNNSAYVTYGDENEYKWTISEIDDPVAEDYEIDKSKSQYVERVYFDVKNTFDNDNNQFLEEPVDDYTSFYFSESDETIWVWNEKKRNYTSIFNIPTETAYKIAKAIDNGDFHEEAEGEQ